MNATLGTALVLLTQSLSGLSDGIGTVEIFLNPNSVQATNAWPDPSVFDHPLLFETENIRKLSPDDIQFMFTDRSNLIIHKDFAELIDMDGITVGNILMNDLSDTANRNLSGKKTPIIIEAPPVVPPPIEGVYKAFPSEMYCRYGCGNIMGVTFPYFYRPFFGYGFPLLGTEQNFPVGYGGNMISQMGVAGGLGPAPPGTGQILGHPHSGLPM